MKQCTPLVKKRRWAGHMIRIVDFLSGIMTKLYLVLKQLKVCIMTKKFMADLTIFLPNIYLLINKYVSPYVTRFLKCLK